MNKKKVFLLCSAITVTLLIFAFLSWHFYKSSLKVNKINDLTLKNSRFSEQWGLYNFGQSIGGQKGTNGIDINILNAWKITRGTKNTIVGVLDTGIDLNSHELHNSIYINIKEKRNNKDDDNNGLIDDVNGWNFYNNSGIIYNSYLSDYHGAFVSGIIAATDEKYPICGVAPEVTILPLKFMRGSEGSTDDAIKAIKYAHSIGARIINCSWDCTVYDSKLESVMKQYSDMLFICSVGKSGDDLSKTPVYPACFNLPNVVSVAAIDNRGTLYRLSGYGDKAQVAAPGVNILSTMPEGDYTYSSGTSEATAFVSGIAALIKSYKPDLTSVQIAGILRSGTRTISTLKEKVKSGGIIDAYACLNEARKLTK
jgi:subtilisin family serine protease